MENSEFRLKWTRNKEMYQKYLNKEEVIAPFQGLIKGFSDDNEISKKLVEIVPNLEEIYINWDSTADIKQIYYSTLDGEKAGIPIIYHHKIVWAIWNGYCMDGTKITKED